MDLDISMSAIMLHNHLSISFPFHTDIHLLLKLMRDTSGNGIPTELTCGEDMERNQYFSLTFESGYGLLGATDKDRGEDVCRRLGLQIDFLELAETITKDDQLRSRHTEAAELINRIAAPY